MAVNQCHQGVGHSENYVESRRIEFHGITFEGRASYPVCEAIGSSPFVFARSDDIARHNRNANSDEVKTDNLRVTS